MEWFYALSGLVGGFLVGLTGVGGGSLMTPLLVMMFGITPVTAVGTDLLYAALTKAGGVWAHSRKHNVDWAVAGRLLLGSVPAALLTLWTLAQFPDFHLDQTLIRRVLACALLLTALALFCGLQQRTCGANLRVSSWATWATPLLGALIGLMVSLTSVGAGAIGTTALIILYPKMSLARIVGTDIAHAVPLTLVAGLDHWHMGHVNGALLINLLLGSLPGIWLGSRFHGLIPEKISRLLLSLLLLGLALQLLR